ncbi:UNVERIFIED_CONTAM: hypothetical protein NCL1_51267 [Trichonephila clavipes]
MVTINKETGIRVSIPSSSIWNLESAWCCSLAGDASKRSKALALSSSIFFNLVKFTTGGGSANNGSERNTLPTNIAFENRGELFFDLGIWDIWCNRPNGHIPGN